MYAKMPGKRPDLLFHLLDEAGGFGIRRRPLVRRKADDFVHFATRRALAITDDVGDHPGPMTAVFLVNMLDHFLAPLVLEIDVDVRRLVALSRDEPLEKQIH